MDLGFNLAQSNRNLKHPTSRQIFGDTSGLLCKNDQILRLNNTAVRYILLQYVYCCCLMLVWVSPSFCECDGRSDLRVAWQHDCSLHLSLSGRLYNAQGCPVICFISFISFDLFCQGIFVGWASLWLLSFIAGVRSWIIQTQSFSGRCKASPEHKEESLPEWVDSVFHLILIIVPFIPLQNFGSSAWSGFASEILGDWWMWWTRSCYFFAPAVLIFGLCTRTGCAVVLIFGSSCANVWPKQFGQLTQLCLVSGD